MTLKEYLRATGITPNEFAISTGIAREIVVRVSAGKGCTARTAEAIIAATHGAVSLADITGSAASGAVAGKSRGGDGATDPVTVRERGEGVA